MRRILGEAWQFVSRDPFAREELYKRRIYAASGCAWCGSVKQTRDGKRSYLFRYCYEPDAGRPSEVSGDFCSISCMRAYHS
jgi:hypothetical protein